MEFASVTEWIESLVAQPIAELENRYPSSFPFDEIRFTRKNTPSDSLLFSLHEHLRGTRRENDLWPTVIWRSNRPLPDAIANDLLDREVADSALGHSRQSDAVQWRMAESYDEALLTLAKEFYTRSDRSFAEFQYLLQRFPYHLWMLTSLSFEVASIPEKETLYFDHVRTLPNVDEILKYYNRGLRMDHAQQTQDVDEITQLFASGDPYVLMGLARNPTTPPNLLEAMSTMRDRPFAGSIRDSAMQTRTRIRKRR